MPYELLKRLCVARLPEQFDDQTVIDKLQVLRTARLIDVDMPCVQSGRGHHCYAGSAIVMRVTPLGKASAASLRGSPVA